MDSIPLSSPIPRELFWPRSHRTHGISPGLSFTPPTGKVWSLSDPVHGRIRFEYNDPAGGLVIKLIDTPWMQRARRIGQTANASAAFPSATHTRFTHVVGAAYCALLACDELYRNSDRSLRAQILQYRTEVVAAALLHDIGHLSGSHLAYKRLFPADKDVHEEIGLKILRGDKEISTILSAEGKNNTRIETVCAILSESESVPRWCRQLISGGGWNIDRGNWTYLDSVMCGIEAGKYNMLALIERLRISPEGELVMEEKGTPALETFFTARKELYRVVYQHPTALAADCIDGAIGRRARTLYSAKELPTDDPTLRTVLSAHSVRDLSVECLFKVTDSWWIAHCEAWREARDPILADLSRRYLDRDLLKPIPLPADKSRSERLVQRAVSETTRQGFKPEYYVEVAEARRSMAKDIKEAFSVIDQHGRVRPLPKVSQLFNGLSRGADQLTSRWLFVPKQVRTKLFPRKDALT